MKTTIEFKDGRVETYDLLYPSVSADDQTVCFVDADCVVMSDDYPLDTVTRVVWEND